MNQTKFIQKYLHTDINTCSKLFIPRTVILANKMFKKYLKVKQQIASLLTETVRGNLIEYML